MLPSTDPIQTIKFKLQELADNWHHRTKDWSDKEWTYRVKEIVVGSTSSYSPTCYATCHSLGEQYEGEWLFDVVWFELDAEKRMVSLPLICESEWKAEEWQINIDFDKLLISHSEYKVFVFQTSNGERVSDEFERLRSRIETFQSTPSIPEKYLLAGFDSNDDGIFHFRAYEKLGNNITNLTI